MNGVGGDLSLSQPVENDDVVLIRQCGQCDNDKCFRIRCSHSFAPKGNGAPAFAENLSREELLWSQRGWVANDEMKFYLETLKNGGNVNTCPPLYFEDEVSQVLVWGRLGGKSKWDRMCNKPKVWNVHCSMAWSPLVPSQNGNQRTWNHHHYDTIGIRPSSFHE